MPELVPEGMAVTRGGREQGHNFPTCFSRGGGEEQWLLNRPQREVCRAGSGFPDDSICAPEAEAASSVGTRDSPAWLGASQRAGPMARSSLCALRQQVPCWASPIPTLGVPVPHCQSFCTHSLCHFHRHTSQALVWPKHPP